MAKYRKDIILIGFFLFIIVICFALYFLQNRSYDPDDPGQAYIYLDGELQRVLDLSEDTSFKLECDDGYNIICVESGFIYVKESDCKSHTCVKTGSISDNGAFIACIPHGLFIRIIKYIPGGDVDAIAY